MTTNNETTFTPATIWFASHDADVTKTLGNINEIVSAAKNVGPHHAVVMSELSSIILDMMATLDAMKTHDV